MKTLHFDSEQHNITPLQFVLRQSCPNIGLPFEFDQTSTLPETDGHTYHAPHQAFVGRMAVPTQEGYRFLSIHDIIACEAEGNYSKMHLYCGKHQLICRNLGKVEEILQEKGFFRLHKQFLVNLAHVTGYTKADGGTVVMSNQQQFAIARSKRDEFINLFEKL